MTAVIDNPILNSPFVEPGRHWVLDDRGIPTGDSGQGRRRSEYIVPVPPAQHITQGMLDLDDEYGKRKPNDIVNEIRDRVAIWRQNRHPGVTPVTRRLLEHWTAKDRARRLPVGAANHAPLDGRMPARRATRAPRVSDVGLDRRPRGRADLPRLRADRVGRRSTACWPARPLPPGPDPNGPCPGV
jgi:hypothetical protein